MTERSTKTVVISGGTDGMGRATALERLRRGDTVVVIGSSAAKAKPLTDLANPRLRFLQANLSSIAETERVVAHLKREHPVVDALLLFANRHNVRRTETADGLEYTFALYYLSRYLLSRELRPVLDASAHPVIVSVAGVGATAGAVNWEDMQLTGRYSTLRAQLNAGRANDLLGVAFAEQAAGAARFVMYHPGFTRSGDLSPLNPVLRWTITTLARFAAKSVDEATGPIHDFIDHPPAAPLTAIDRGKPVAPTLKTLDKGDALRLAELTEELLSARRHRAAP